MRSGRRSVFESNRRRSNPNRADARSVLGCESATSRGREAQGSVARRVHRAATVSASNSDPNSKPGSDAESNDASASTTRRRSRPAARNPRRPESVSNTYTPVAGEGVARNALSARAICFTISCTIVSIKPTFDVRTKGGVRPHVSSAIGDRRAFVTRRREPFLGGRASRTTRRRPTIRPFRAGSRGDRGPARARARPRPA